MADLVNSTHKERLSQRDSEPTHLKGGSWDDLGGARIDSEPNSVKIDAAKGVKGQDTSIIGAGQNSEKSHVGKSGTLGEAEGDDVDVKFDGDDDEDDIDKSLDQFEDVEPVDIDVDMDDDKKVVKESENFDLGGGAEAGGNDGKMKSNAGPADAAMQSGPNKVTEDDLPPWLKKDGDKGKDEVKEGEEIVIKQSDDDKDEKSEKKDDGDKKNENPFAKKSEKVEEGLRIRITRPNVKLMEAAGIPAEAQKKVALVFESVIKDVTGQIAKQVVRHYKKLHESKLAQRDAALAKKVDAYLNYVTEEWMKTNRVPVRTSLKAQLAEEFLGAFQSMMKEHYISVPDSKVDVVKTLSAQVTKLKASLTEQVSQKLKLRRIAEAANKARIVSDFTKTAKLSEAQTAKLNKLTEAVPYTNSKEFREKVGMLAESYFGTAAKKPIMKVAGVEGGQHLTEEKIQEEKGRKVSSDPDVEVIAAALKRQANASKY